MPTGADFDEFYAGTCRRLVGQVYAMLGDLTEAEDAVQEAYTRAWLRWSRVREYGDPEAWVRTARARPRPWRVWRPHRTVAGARQSSNCW